VSDGTPDRRVLLGLALALLLLAFLLPFFVGHDRPPMPPEPMAAPSDVSP
jgi:hypothetical protein